MGSSDETSLLLETAPAARQGVLAEIFTRHRDRLRSMLELRLDRRLQARMDPSDILQETFVEASRKLEEYCGDPRLPIFLWLRGLAAQKLIDLHRHHFHAGKRNAEREISFDQARGPSSQTWAMAEFLMGHQLSPSQVAVKAETKVRLEKALDQLEEMDREILALRHFECLTAAEAAKVLGIKLETAKKRYVRAMVKLRQILIQMPGAWEDLQP
jgi:RNA polymerase sigma-70 factor, ECF subfamily